MRSINREIGLTQTRSMLSNFRSAINLLILDARETLEPEERDLMMQLSPLYLEKIQAAEQVGEVKEAQTLILRLLARRVGVLSPAMQERVKALPLVILEDLGEALLDFTSLADLETWLSRN